MFVGLCAIGANYPTVLATRAFRNPTALITIIDDLEAWRRRVRHQEATMGL